MTDADDAARSPVDGAVARFRGVRAARVVESVDVLAEPEKIAAGGWWAVVGEFSGTVRAWRFDPARRGTEPVAMWVLLPVEFRLK